jgi:hypothetical protein
MIIELPRTLEFVAERVDLGQFHLGVEQHDGKRDGAEKRLTREPQ